MVPTDVVDTERYPLNEAGSDAYCALVDACRTNFREDGVALLPGFITLVAQRDMLAEAQAREADAFFCRNEHNVYLGPADLDRGPAHPRNRMLRTDVGSIANDYLDPYGALQQLYAWPALTSFIANVVGSDQLFVSDDPLGAVSINVFGPGDAHAWHFDESRFSVTLMVQAAEQGGAFEYTEVIRQEDDGDVAAISSYINGDSLPTTLPFAPRTLSIFAGRHTMHRVTKVKGDRSRFVPVLTYSDAPGYQNSPEVRRLFWGRDG